MTAQTEIDRLRWVGASAVPHPTGHCGPGGPIASASGGTTAASASGGTTAASQGGDR